MVDTRAKTMYTYIVERTQIYLTEEEASALDREAQARGVTRSHLIREAIDVRYRTSRESQAQRLLAALEELGPPWALRDDMPDGERYVERVRGGAGCSPVTHRRANPPTRHCR